MLYPTLGNFGGQEPTGSRPRFCASQETDRAPAALLLPNPTDKKPSPLGRQHGACLASHWYVSEAQSYRLNEMRDLPGLGRMVPFALELS